MDHDITLESARPLRGVDDHHETARAQFDLGDACAQAHVDSELSSPGGLELDEVRIESLDGAFAPVQDGARADELLSPDPERPRACPRRDNGGP